MFRDSRVFWCAAQLFALIASAPIEFPRDVAEAHPDACDLALSYVRPATTWRSSPWSRCSRTCSRIGAAHANRFAARRCLNRDPAARPGIEAITHAEWLRDYDWGALRARYAPRAVDRCAFCLENMPPPCARLGGRRILPPFVPVITSPASTTWTVREPPVCGDEDVIRSPWFDAF